MDAPEPFLAPGPAEWLATWSGFRTWLKGLPVLRKGEQRLTLAPDKYESLHGLLRYDRKRAGALLGEMRSVSQHQSRVILLFSGAALLSEIKDLPQDRYFVQSVRLGLDCLSRDETLRPIRDPVVPSLRYVR